MKDYNGWKNYETWNISLWIRNDERLCNLALESIDYPDFCLRLRDLGVIKTPDNVYYADVVIDLKSLNEVINEIKD